MTEHTKGPWEVHPQMARIYALLDDGAAPVCQLLWPTELRSEAETMANARLIAAAPDLLAALKQAMKRLQFHIDNSPTSAADLSAINLAKSIIANVERDA